jgi:hypothetical protein
VVKQGLVVLSEVRMWLREVGWWRNQLLNQSLID